MGWSGEGAWKSDDGSSSSARQDWHTPSPTWLGYKHGKRSTDSNYGGADGQGFSAFGMGGKSGALGKYDYLGAALDDANPWLQADKERKRAEEEARARAQKLYEQTGLLNQNLNAADTSYKGAFDKNSTAYLNQMRATISGYQNDIRDLRDQAEGQANDARMTYTNTLLPEMKNAMEWAGMNASQAMTLGEASDPNNPVQLAIRDMYDQLGHEFSTDILNQGKQDFGVLSALGAQGAAQQFGAAGPMTAGQQGQVYARGQEQAGNAYARAQQEAANRLRDLQQQGINRGFDQSNYLYEQGQQAQDRYSNRIGDLQNLEHNFNADQQGFRDEIGGYAGDIMGSESAYTTDKYNMGMTGADIDRTNIYAGTGRDQNALNQLYGAEQTAANNNLQAGMANNASKGQFYSSLLGMFAGGMGGMAGNGFLKNSQNQQQPTQGYSQGQPYYSTTGYQPYA